MSVNTSKTLGRAIRAAVGRFCRVLLPVWGATSCAPAVEAGFSPCFSRSGAHCSPPMHRIHVPMHGVAGSYCQARGVGARKILGRGLCIGPRERQSGDARLGLSCSMAQLAERPESPYFEVIHDEHRE
jgi:hypothetical protein